MEREKEKERERVDPQYRDRDVSYLSSLLLDREHRGERE
jgi:hypothetical protein